MPWSKLFGIIGVVATLVVVFLVQQYTMFRGDVVMARHGESEANKAGIIVSQFEHAHKAYGLTSDGAKQAESAGWQIRTLFPNRKILVVSSPFLRAEQSAQIMANILQAEPYVVDARLGERNFSAFEFQSVSNYEQVWSYDRAGQRLSPIYHGRVEELENVDDRVRDAMNDYKKKNRDAVIVFVTHGDVASIAIADNRQMPLMQHREAGGLSTGGFRVLHRD